jgi:hypothetical protein
VRAALAGGFDELRLGDVKGVNDLMNASADTPRLALEINPSVLPVIPDRGELAGENVSPNPVASRDAEVPLPEAEQKKGKRGRYAPLAGILVTVVSTRIKDVEYRDALRRSILQACD